MPTDKTVNVQGLKSRDPRQISLLVEMYSDSVYHVCISYVFNKSDAEELTQDVFISCLSNINMFEGKSSLKTWLYRIAVNKSLDFVKYKQRKKRSAHIISLSGKNDDSISYKAVERKHPGIQLESQEQMAALYQAIEMLPERQKTALILMKIDGRSQQEAGEIMGIKAKAVESLVQRAKKNLRTKLSEIYDNI